jgi:hypothetical protein
MVKQDFYVNLKQVIGVKKWLKFIRIKIKVEKWVKKEEKELFNYLDLHNFKCK